MAASPASSPKRSMERIRRTRKSSLGWRPRMSSAMSRLARTASSPIPIAIPSR